MLFHCKVIITLLPYSEVLPSIAKIRGATFGTFKNTVAAPRRDVETCPSQKSAKIFKENWHEVGLEYL